MTTTMLRTTALAALLAAAGAATASAHTSVYTSDTKVAAKVGDAPATIGDGPVNYLVANHGHNVVLKEDNGLSGGGALNYKELPSAWRKEQTKATLLATATGAQVHATCQVPALQDQAAILEWQEADPFYAYVPFQAAAAGLGDEEEVGKWIAVVKARTGVDLATTTNAEAACQGIGGAFKKADSTQTTGATLAAGDIALVADPLTKQIDGYKAQLATADAAKTTAAAAIAQRDAALKAAASPLTVTLPTAPTKAALTGTGVQASVVGSPNAPVEVVLTVTKKQQTTNRLPTRTLAAASSRLDATGKGGFTLKASAKTTKALAKVSRGLTISVTARINVSASTQTTLGS